MVMMMTHTHTPSRQRRAREGAQAAAHHATWEWCSRLRAGQSLKGGPLSPDTKKQKKTVVSLFLMYRILQPATLAPWRSVASACEKNEFRLRVLSRSRLTPHGLRTLPRVAGITPSIYKRESLQKISGVYANHARDGIAPWMGLGKGCDWPYDFPRPDT